MLEENVNQNETVSQSEVEKKRRNPFVYIHKVFKYEFFSLMRTFLPLCVILLVLGLVNGLVIDENFFSYDEAAGFKKTVFGVAVALFFLFLFICEFVVFFGIHKRFKTSMLSREAYLNLTLPVTMFEHLTGKVLCGLVNMLILSFVLIVSFCLLGIKYYSEIFAYWDEIEESLNQFLVKANMNIVQLWIESILYVLSSTVYMISTLFVVNTAGHLIPKGRRIVKIIMFVILIYIPNYFQQSMTVKLIQKDWTYFPGFLLAASLLFLFAGALYLFVTGMILRNNLQVE